MFASDGLHKRLLGHAAFLYGEKAGECLDAIFSVLAMFEHVLPFHGERQLNLSQEDLILICYGDMVQGEENPLKELNSFLGKHLRGVFSFVHILPFFPFSSDDGFSVIDFFKVNPALGTWDDIGELRNNTRLMFDFVGNHISSKSDLFIRFLQGDGEQSESFIQQIPGADYSCVLRPRTSPLFTPFTRSDGDTTRVWTTFSEDQIDLNYQSLQVLRMMVHVMLWYVAHGASALRLDAVNYLWKLQGTRCSSLPQTHALIQLFRAILDFAAPSTLLITETNVPNEENLSYLGNGSNEAQLVYQFALPPLLVHAFMTGNTTYIKAWLNTLDYNADSTYLNFLASHDGVGLMPVMEILPKPEIDNMVDLARKRGSLVSYKSLNGLEIPYELNCTFYDLLQDPSLDESTNMDQYISAHSLLLSLRGVPAVYFHSLFGSRNAHSEYVASGKKRAVNRKRFDRNLIDSLLENHDARETQLFKRLLALIDVRKSNPAFHPQSSQTVDSVADQVLLVRRVSGCGRHQAVCAVNFSRSHQTVELPENLIYTLLSSTSGVHMEASRADIPAYGYGWIGVRSDHEAE